MERQRQRDSIWTMGPPPTTALLIAVLLIASYATANAEDDMARQKAYLRSLVPQVEKPSPTAAQSDRGFIAYWAPPTTNFYGNIPPTARDLRRRAVIRTFPGEDEPLLLGVWGLRDMNYASVWVTKPVFEISVRVPESAVGAYTLPDSMGQLEILSWLAPDAPQKVRRGRNAFYWINVHVPQGTAPGTYHGQINLTVSDTLGEYLSKPGGWANVTWKQQFGYARVKLPITVEVLPVSLPRADIAYGMYFRGLSARMLPPQYLTEPMMMSYYRDMARHGHTSAYLAVYEKLHHGDGTVAIRGLPWPEPRFEPGTDYDELPELKTAKQIEMMLEAGLIHHDVPIMIDYAWGPTWYDNHEAVSRFAANLRAEFERRGWPEPLRYGPDEPDATGPRAAMFREVFKEFALTRPGQRLVTAISPEHVEGFVDDLDVWVVFNRGPTQDSSMNELFQKFQQMAVEHDAEVWTYMCTAYGTNPKYHRYYAGLLTWAHQLKGNFLWCYAEYHTWEGNRAGANYNYVLPSKDGPVPSIGWEARREGIEDYRILRRIETLCRQKQGPIVDAARDWIEKLRQRVITPRNEEGPALPGVPKRHIQNIAPQFGRGEIADIRNQAIDLLIDLERD